MTSEIASLASDVLQGSRVALAKAITLVESTRADHRAEAESLLSQLIKKTGHSMRIAISGPPGVGKSSLIEALGMHLLASGRKLAVLAIDPSSPITGGSILGDKTRMEELSRSPSCFIRPSPSSGSLGGVARHTRETMLLCEAAGFDIIFIETVGIGQSEYLAASMTDIFVQLHQPFSGDELQGIKKGVMELADLVLVTKADGESKKGAEVAKRELERALSLVRGPSGEETEVITVSSREKTAIDFSWRKIQEIHDRRILSGELRERRRHQTHDWLRQEITNSLLDALTSHPKYEPLLEKTFLEVEKSDEHCARAARKLVASLIRSVN